MFFIVILKYGPFELLEKRLEFFAIIMFIFILFLNTKMIYNRNSKERFFQVNKKLKMFLFRMMLCESFNFKP